jgi:hypothetical protein
MAAHGRTGTVNLGAQHECMLAETGAQDRAVGLAIVDRQCSPRAPRLQRRPRTLGPRGALLKLDAPIGQQPLSLSLRRRTGVPPGRRDRRRRRLLYIQRVLGRVREEGGRISSHACA